MYRNVSTTAFRQSDVRRTQIFVTTMGLLIIKVGYGVPKSHFGNDTATVCMFSEQRARSNSIGGHGRQANRVGLFRLNYP